MRALSRRDFVTKAVQATAGAALMPSELLAAPKRPAAPASPTIPYGAAVRGGTLATDKAYREAVLKYCDVIVPESELKWVELQPNRGEFRFDRADAVAAFARDNGLALRGHTLVWYGALPYWTDDLRDRRDAEKALTEHIEKVVSRYRGQIRSWDVVNEPIGEHPRNAQDLRNSVWLKHLGSDYVSFAFRAAAQVDPRAQLVLNEYDIEFIGEQFRNRRESLLHLLRRMMERGDPLHAIGLQAHLSTDRTIDRDGLQSFLAEIKQMGLRFLITELDVVDFNAPSAAGERDALIAAKAEELLQTVGEVIVPEQILTWGISDRYTWVPIYFKRTDGTLNRPLPLDDQMRPKPFMASIDRFRRQFANTQRRQG